VDTGVRLEFARWQVVHVLVRTIASGVSSELRTAANERVRLREERRLYEAAQIELLLSSIEFPVPVTVDPAKWPTPSATGELGPRALRQTAVDSVRATRNGNGAEQDNRKTSDPESNGPGLGDDLPPMVATCIE
jgi:hypothetical protein